MGRRRSAKLSRRAQRSLHTSEPASTQALAPLRPRNPALSAPPAQVLEPDPITPGGTSLHHFDDPHDPARALNPRPTYKALPAHERRSTDDMLEQMGQQTLVGQSGDDGNEFWIDLKQEILGGLQIRVSMQKKQIKATLIAPSDTIAFLLQQRISELEAHLRQRGLVVQQLHIQVRNQKK